MEESALPETCCRATIWVRLGHAAYLGPSLKLDAHSGSVDCFAYGVDGPFTLRTGDGERDVRGVLIPARTRHQVISDGRMLFLYLEPGLTDTADDRIRTAIALLRSDPGLNAAQVAAGVGLSTSRFLHLFPAGAGTSFRRYRLWARMVHVAGAVSRGADLTRASAEAGFASPSHFSDSFHAMFGLTASALLATTRLIVSP
ncbi:helix-turn-helix domain-containing protein [Lentzea flava]|uniref:Transcriptional regulator n=1 Tax=Lentzea flava TaxID=103732 RepID=A0ABQ2UJY3_9PSEU|nr:AraC family transcriptional regulator [Lentzea flava]MCP2200342.1 AraC-type DNA-binding protein [Lentzea flava]GGU41647.1 transcriptional regulator [Lentzea flava]